MNPCFCRGTCAASPSVRVCIPAPFLPLRRYLALLLRRRPRVLQRRGLLCGRPRPAQDLLETGEHHLVEVGGCQNVEVVTEGAGLCWLRQVVEDLLEQRGNVESLRVYRMSRDSVERLHDYAGGIVLLEIIYERDSSIGVLRLFGYKHPRTHPGRRHDAGAVYGGEREETDLEVLDRLDDLRHEPRAGDVHGGLACIEQGVGVIVGDGVYAIRIVAALHEVPEEEVDGFLHLGGVPLAVSVEDVVQPFSAQHVAGPDAE